MIVVSGGDLVLPARIVTEGALVIDGGRIAAIESHRVDPAGATIVDAADCYVVPGFIDVHVHGLHGHDTLDEGDAVARIAAHLPRYGVTAFCPTTVAWPPGGLRRVLQQVRLMRSTPSAGSARVPPAATEYQRRWRRASAAASSSAAALAAQSPRQPAAGSSSGESASARPAPAGK